jgi:hypothetical protein
MWKAFVESRPFGKPQGAGYCRNDPFPSPGDQALADIGDFQMWAARTDKLQDT